MGHGWGHEPRPRAWRPQRGDEPTADSAHPHSPANLGRGARGRKKKRGRFTDCRGQEGRSWQEPGSQGNLVESEDRQEEGITRLLRRPTLMPGSRCPTIHARPSSGATLGPARPLATRQSPPSAARTPNPAPRCGWPAKRRRCGASAVTSSRIEGCTEPRPRCAATGSTAAAATVTTPPEHPTADFPVRPCRSTLAIARRPDLRGRRVHQLDPSTPRCAPAPQAKNRREER